MRVRVVIEREIVPNGSSTCSVCPWRDGHACDLFVTELVPVTESPFEVCCHRASECREAERGSSMETEKAVDGKKRYWVGWTSRLENVDTPFPKWKTRATRAGRAEPGATYLISYAAVIDADDREKAWHAVAERYADATEQYVREKARDFWPPRDRFPKASWDFRADAEKLVEPHEVRG